MPAIPHLVAFHAAAVQRDGRPFLLAGQSGAGKRTLRSCPWTSRLGLRCGRNRVAKADLPAHAASASALFKGERSEPSRRGFLSFGLPANTTDMESESDTYQYDRLNSKVGPDLGFPRYDRSGRNDIQSLDSFVGLQRLLAQCIFVPLGFQARRCETVAPMAQSAEILCGSIRSLQIAAVAY